jgi:polyisoprenoid-binding protein YceI|tara:strand:- start:24873 stop:25406 length:534 start_codon:yes stop_codon:yes gene_type:complete
MKNIQHLFLAASITLLSAFTISESIDWKISSNHSIKFSGTDAEGIFKTMSGDVAFDEANLSASKFDFKIDVKSINTGNGMKNKHAVSDKWFDADKFPNIEFKSKSFTKSKTGYTVTGSLKMHGIEKSVTIPFTFSSNTFKAKFSVNRLDYKIGTMEGMMKKVSNEIKLDVSIPVTKK